MSGGRTVNTLPTAIRDGALTVEMLLRAATVSGKTIREKVELNAVEARRKE